MTDPNEADDDSNGGWFGEQLIGKFVFDQSQAPKQSNERKVEKLSICY